MVFQSDLLFNIPLLSIARNGSQAYGKNLRIQMGRCPVRSIFPQALEKLQQKQHLLGFVPK